MCQCPKCSYNAVEKSPFCGVHNRSVCKIMSPLSGFEPKYEPHLWNRDKGIKHSHNCFAYAVNYIDGAKADACRNTIGCDVRFHVPGKDKGHRDFRQKQKRQRNYMTCSDVVGRTESSLGGKILGFEDPCPPMMSKIAIVVDDKNDLHYYRQDSNGWWSHKPGGTAVTNLDAAGVRIYCPERAARTYYSADGGSVDLDYRYFCCYMAIPRVGPTAKRIQLAGSGSAPESAQAQASQRRHKTAKRSQGSTIVRHRRLSI